MMDREKGIIEMGKNYSPKRSRVRRSRVSKKDLVDDQNEGSQINILIPTLEQTTSRNEEKEKQK